MFLSGMVGSEQQQLSLSGGVGYSEIDVYYRDLGFDSASCDFLPAGRIALRDPPYRRLFRRPNRKPCRRPCRRPYRRPRRRPYRLKLVINLSLKLVINLGLGLVLKMGTAPQHCRAPDRGRQPREGRPGTPGSTPQ